MTASEEATLFSMYIVGSPPSSKLIARYMDFIRPIPPLKKEDRKILTFIHTHPRLLGAVDAYTALFQPHAEIRRRLYSMFAILEATPEYTDKFLPKDGGSLYFLRIIGVSLRALSRLLIGVVVMIWIGFKR